MISIDVFCVFDEASKPYAEHLYTNMSCLSSGKYRLHFKHIALGGKFIAKGWDTVSVVRPDSYQPSFAHATALSLIPTLASAHYTVLVDSDFAVLCSDWDDLVISCFKCGVGIVGVEYDSLGLHYKAFPNVIFMVTPTELIKTLSINFYPSLSGNKVTRKLVENKTEELHSGIPIGRLWKLDTGYRIPGVFIEQGYKCKTAKLIKATSSNAKLDVTDYKALKKHVGNTIKQCEYHLDGELFATHLLASRNYSLNSNYVQFWFNRVALTQNKLLSRG